MNIKSVDACFRANFYYLAFFFIFLVRMWAFCLEKYMPAVYKKKKKKILKIGVMGMKKIVVIDIRQFHLFHLIRQVKVSFWFHSSPFFFSPTRPF